MALLQQSAPASAGFLLPEQRVPEFPMWVTHESGATKIVDSEEALAALGGGWTKPETATPVPREKTAEFVEYPKWVGDVLVQNAEEESALLGSDDAETRAALLQIAAEKG
jgi:hypothetical protein